MPLSLPTPIVIPALLHEGPADRDDRIAAAEYERLKAEDDRRRTTEYGHPKAKYARPAAGIIIHARRDRRVGRTGKRVRTVV